MSKKSIIKEMFSGGRGTFDKVKLSDEYELAENDTFAVVDAFSKQLTAGQNEMFEKAYDSIMDRNVEYATDHFVEGFKLGLLLGIECAED